MRGTGYAISEILIFLAIASIIGFLLGWVVFSRRGAGNPAPAQLDVKELRRAETRVKALEALMAKAERRAEAAAAAASRAATIAPAAAGVSPSTPKAKKGGTAPEPVTDEKKPAEKVREPIKADAEKEPAMKTPEPAKPQAGKEPATKTPEPAKPQAGKEPAKPGTGDADLDEYLTDADDRIEKLEKTLERLRGKLDDLEA